MKYPNEQDKRGASTVFHGLSGANRKRKTNTGVLRGFNVVSREEMLDPEAGVLMSCRVKKCWTLKLES
jgi:hypothetical protein